MKKQKLVRKLSLKKTVVSSLGSRQIVGGTNSFRRGCGPIDLSLLETCTPECDLTVTCTQFDTCNDITFNNCTVHDCNGQTAWERRKMYKYIPKMIPSYTEYIVFLPTGLVYQNTTFSKETSRECMLTSVPQKP